ncbi:MAG: PilZ domain-containing protein [Deltaproteobacteria bacterium]|nr:PilZ domain-containing protein [Deltaproteobacteria bacterium]
MFVPGDPRFDEILTLANRAAGAGLLDSQRPRWRELCSELLGSVHAQATGGSERRKAIRGSAQLQVRLLEPQEIEGLVSSSVSSGGLAIPTSSPLPMGTIIEMSIQTETRAMPFFVKATVVWVTEDAMGVMFTDLVQSNRELLEAIAVKAVLARLATE